ncbi:MAG: peptide ABC transporter substrate-binding protein [Simkania negevensis]|nr:peptide ABC transporter substrate-binding protein [Simkania negevensis]
MGIFVGIHFLHKYELFSEEHLLRALQKIMPDLQHIAGGVYSFQQHKDPFKFLYIEVEKKGGLPFSLVERKLLRQNLKEVLKRGVERLHPSIFMLSNEEEIVKNILLLSREIRVLRDLPQVMIHFDEQSEKEVSFQILVAYLGKKDLSLLDFFEQSQVAYLPLREQIVRHLRKKYPVRAQFFKLTLSKTSEMLRSDLSLNFYAAREKICNLLSNAFGEFRDYNGGLILKQGETLTKFKEAFSSSSPELLDNFFYAITPIEAQATLPLNSLSILFELFVEGQNHCLLRKKDHFAKIAQYEGETYAFFKIKGCSDLEQFIEEFKHLQKYLISVRLGIEDATCLCYLFRGNVIAEHNLFVNLFHRAIESWKNKGEGTKTLRLAIDVKILSLDPRIQGGEGTKVILRMLFEGLMRFDPSGQVIFGMAKSVRVSRDKKKYTFQLRPAHWSNDTPVTANDFVYAWRTLLSPSFKTPFAYLFYPIKNAQEIKEGRLDPTCLGVQALGKNILEIQLASPTPYFLELLAQSQFSPIHAAVDQLHPTWSNQEGMEYICNGAFLLRKKYSYQGCELVKNPYYYDTAKVQIDRVTIKSALLPEIREMFIRDEIDWLGFPTGAISLSSLPLTHGETLALPNDSSYWYIFNTQQYPFHSVKIRRAFASVVDRAQILQAISPGYWPAFTPVSLKHSQTCLLKESQQKATGERSWQGECTV